MYRFCVLNEDFVQGRVVAARKKLRKVTDYDSRKVRLGRKVKLGEESRTGRNSDWGVKSDGGRTQEIAESN